MRPIISNRQWKPHCRKGFLLVVGMFYLSLCSVVQASTVAERRQEMIETIQDITAETAHMIGKSHLSPRVLEIMGRIPRHEFVPPAYRQLAYANRPLPIGYGQTISQPYIVALMTDLLEPEPEDIALEVGTGSGYQAAVLAELVKTVYTIEIIPELYQQARDRLEKLDYANVAVRNGDGFYGWDEAAPFDSIIVTAAGKQVPPPLIDQLKPGGKMILPVGDLFSVQYLVLIEKQADETLTTRNVLPVSFVPLTGKH